MRERLRALKFEPATAERCAQMWAAANETYAFTITREGPRTFVGRVSKVEGSKPCIIARCRSFDAAARECDSFTSDFRRQIAVHEAGHAVAARLLGLVDISVNMKDDDGCARVYMRNVGLTAALAGGDRAAMARALYIDLLVSLAGPVAEGKLAGYLTTYIEEDVCWVAARLVRIEAGLPICVHRKCETGIEYSEAVAAVIARAEAETIALLKDNWQAVMRITDALCEQDQLTTIDLTSLLPA